MGHSFPPQQRPLLLLSSRPWNSALADRLSRCLDRPVESIIAPAQLTPAALRRLIPSGSSWRIGVIGSLTRSGAHGPP